jgi:hypothetical protein
MRAMVATRSPRVDAHCCILAKRIALWSRSARLSLRSAHPSHAHGSFAPRPRECRPMHSRRRTAPTFRDAAGCLWSIGEEVQRTRIVAFDRRVTEELVRRRLLFTSELGAVCLTTVEVDGDWPSYSDQRFAELLGSATCLQPSMEDVELWPRPRIHKD